MHLPQTDRGVLEIDEHGKVHVPGGYDVNNVFTYHPPFGDQADRYEILRGRARDMARGILDFCPDSPERAQALVRLEECVMHANASIARNEKAVA